MHDNDAASPYRRSTSYEEPPCPIPGPPVCIPSSRLVGLNQRIFAPNQMFNESQAQQDRVALFWYVERCVHVAYFDMNIQEHHPLPSPRPRPLSLSGSMTLRTFRPEDEYFPTIPLECGRSRHRSSSVVGMKMTPHAGCSLHSRVPSRTGGVPTTI
jgi:hypothetical protein